MNRYAQERAADRVAWLSGQGLDLPTFWGEVREVLAPAVPHHLAPCWYTFDPASLLVTSHYDHGLIPELPRDWLAHQYFDDDVHKLADVARSRRGISTLHEATDGDPSRSPNWQEYIRPYGGDQELLLALRTPRGDAWGMLALYRESRQPLYTHKEIELLLTLAPFLAQGIWRALLLGDAVDPEGPASPGLLVLKDDWSVESITPGAERWLSELPGDWEREVLPPSVLSVAGRARRTAESDSPGEVAVARVLTPDGRWIVLHGAALVTSASRRVAIIIEPAQPARISPLLMAAYELTEREQDVTRLVLAGDSTAQMAEQLFVSPHTIQQHLKSVFDKTGVRSRRELVGKVFFSHYEPRLRDNEHRVIDGRPIRGGPLPR